MTKRFTPEIPSRIGKIQHQILASDQLADLFTNAKYLYKGQRDHGKNASKRRHVQGKLSGGSQQFVGAYCEDLKCYKNIDGYHRGQEVADGNASFGPGFDIELSVFRVRSESDLDDLYDQYNSAEAGKKSACYFESGLRMAGIAQYISSDWILGPGKSSAVQFAAGVKGTKSTRKAVVKMSAGIRFCNDLKLPRTAHVMSGLKGALIAIAQYSSSARHAETFIRNMCAEAFDPKKPSASEMVLMTYRDKLLTNGFGGSSGGPNNKKLSWALAAFARYSALEQGRTPMKEMDITLAEFIRKMNELAPKKV